MRGRELDDIFRALADVPIGATLSSSRVAPKSEFRIARDNVGDAVLLLSIPKKSKGPSPKPVRLMHLEYHPCVTAVVRDGKTKAATEGEFLLLRCREGDPALRRHFFELVAGLIDYLGHAPQLTKVHEAVSDLLELFRAMSAPARETVVGLWAELFTIAEARDIDVAVAAWHSDPGEQHDFVRGLERIEIKATTRPTRQHDVSLEQLVVPKGGSCVLISLMLVRSDVGASISDLVATGCERLPLGSESRRRLQAIVAETLGDSWAEATTERFDLAAARTSRATFAAQDVPSVDSKLPPSVSHVRFRVDLSATTQYSGSAAAGSLLKALSQRT